MDQYVMLENAAKELRQRAIRMEEIGESVAFASVSGTEEPDTIRRLRNRIQEQSRELCGIVRSMEEVAEQYQNLKLRLEQQDHDLPEFARQGFGTSYFGNLEEQEHLIPIHTE